MKEQMTERIMAWTKAWIWEMGCIWRMLGICLLSGVYVEWGWRIGVDSASVVRVRCAWRKFKELPGILTRKEASL